MIATVRQTAPKALAYLCIQGWLRYRMKLTPNRQPVYLYISP